jgi:hypothetical protein
MVTSSMPFSFQASLQDPFYKYIVLNREDLYWRSVHAATSHLSAPLKQLLYFMFQYTPFTRLTMAELISHPWVNEPVPTHEEVKLYLSSRKRDVDTKAEKALVEDIKKFDEDEEASRARNAAAVA